MFGPNDFRFSIFGRLDHDRLHPFMHLARTKIPDLESICDAILYWPASQSKKGNDLQSHKSSDQYMYVTDNSRINSAIFFFFFFFARVDEREVPFVLCGVSKPAVS
jgi:hypothetical protein